MNTVRHPSAVMAWGSFSYFSVGNIVILDKGECMNTETHLDILHDNQRKVVKAVNH